MKFIFNYFEFIDNSIYKRNFIKPICSSYNKTKEEEIVASYVSEIQDKLFLDNIIQCLKNYKNQDISSQSWNCVVIKEKVIISFLYDLDNKEYITSIKLTSLLRLLDTWFNFLRREIYLNYEEIIEV